MSSLRKPRMLQPTGGRTRMRKGEPPSRKALEERGMDVKGRKIP